MVDRRLSEAGIGVSEAAGKLAEELLMDYGSALGQAVFAGAPGLDVEDAELALMIRDPEGLTRHWPWELLRTLGGEIGAILFENKARNGAQPAPGRAVANALSSGRVKMLLLIACHSAQAPLVQPMDGGSEQMFGTRAIASFAEEVATNSEINVVAMSHQLSVSNAVHIVDDLYRCLSVGGSLADAVRYARRRWMDGGPSPGSQLGHATIRVFVNKPSLSEVKRLPAYAPPRLSNLTTNPTKGMAVALSNPPALFGRDDTILTLDRIFDDRIPILSTNCGGREKRNGARAWPLAGGEQTAGPIRWGCFGSCCSNRRLGRSPQTAMIF